MKTFHFDNILTEIVFVLRAKKWQVQKAALRDTYESVLSASLSNST